MESSMEYQSDGIPRCTSLYAKSKSLLGLLSFACLPVGDVI